MFETNYCVPDIKAKKYDRQLRLWGDHGQISLECAKVCLVNCDSTGVEILKNLILPGVGSFTIIDDHVVAAQDIAVNFFLTEEHIGKLRGECVTELLKELNPDVTGSCVPESLDNLLEATPDFFQTFQLVIVLPHSHESLLKLSNALWAAEVPVLVVQVSGMLAVVRLVVNEHTVIEAHPDNHLLDLHLDRPFPELLTIAQQTQLHSMTLKEHSHVPWLILVLKYLQEWQHSQQSSFPTTFAHKKQIKELISEGKRCREDGLMEEEENFDEAVRNANKALLPTTVPSHIIELFSHPNCVNIHSESKCFWIIVRALKNFSEETGHLPLRGNLPDMTSDTSSYIRLQQAYRQEACRQADRVMRHVEQILCSVGRDEPLIVKKSVKPSPTSSPAKPEDCITSDDVTLFCKTAPYLKVVQTPPLHHQLSDQRGSISRLAKSLEVGDEECDDLIFLILFEASLRFYDRHNRHPGSLNDHEADIALFKSCVLEHMKEHRLSPSFVRDDLIHEFCRFGHSEIPSVGAMVGGVVAQEAIKAITHQFVPLNNTLIYNSIKQSTHTFTI